MPSPENKTKIISVRFRPTELEYLDTQAAAVNLSRSAYITRKLTGLPVLPARVPPVNWQLYRELAHIASELPPIGNNLNQIAKVLNTKSLLGESLPETLPNPQSLLAIVQLIQQTQTLLKQVRLELSGVGQENP
jgi:hypothetical protein